MAWEWMANPYRSLSCAGNLRIELLHITSSTVHGVHDGENSRKVPKPMERFEQCEIRPRSFI
jgi:hypothetical protein